MSECRALAIIDDAKKRGALSFVSRDECMGTAALYKAEVTVMQLRLPKERYDANADVYEISGKYMPKREVVDRIGEASGLSFVKDGCKTWTETRDDDICGKRTVYISEQQARRRMSDGSWRESSVQTYEFDPVLRAMDDFGETELTAQTKNKRKVKKDGSSYGPTLAQTILAYTKVARQRAETGARLRVIRELTGMPTAFSKDEAAKPLVFGRFAQNTDYILSTPEGRAMATAQALGQDVSSLFGNRALPQAASDTPQAIEDMQYSNGTQGSTSTPPDAVQDGDAMQGSNASPTNANRSGETWDDTLASDAFDFDDAKQGNDFERASEELRKLAEDNKAILDRKLKDGSNPYLQIQAELRAMPPTASIESRQSMIDKVNAFIDIVKAKAQKEAA